MGPPGPENDKARGLQYPRSHTAATDLKPAASARRVSLLLLSGAVSCCCLSRRCCCRRARAAENLAAHRCSHLLSRSRGILLISQKLRVRGRPRRPQRAWAFKGPSKMASRGINAGAPCAGADRSESATSSGWPHTLGGCGDNTWRGLPSPRHAL